MRASDLLRLPLTAPRLLARALDDLNAIAENARAQPDAVTEIKALLAAISGELAATIVIAQEIVSGGSELDQTGRVLDAHAVQVIDGGQDLVEVARSLDETLAVFRRQLPRLLQALDTVEGLEDAAETMADTLEPLQGTAERVGRITNRLSRS